MLAFMDSRDEWIGTPAALLEEFRKIAEEEKIDTKSKLWPGSASWLTRRIAEVETNLIEAGITFDRRHGDERTIRLSKNSRTNAVGSVGAVQVSAMLEVPPDATADGTDGKGNGVGIASVRKTDKDNGLHGTDGTDGTDGILSTTTRSPR